MRVPMLVVAMIATPFLANVSQAQSFSGRDNRHNEEQEVKRGEKRHRDKNDSDKCDKESRAKGNHDNNNQQGQHEDNDGQRAGSKDCTKPPVTPPPTGGGTGSPPPTAPIAEIHGMAFSDLNGNGTYDAADLPLSGWTIQVTGAASATVTTASDGTYIVAQLPVGLYTVCAASGLTQTAPAAGPACGSGNPGYSLEVPANMPDVWITGIDFALK